MEAADEDVDGGECVAIPKDFQTGARGACVCVTALPGTCLGSLWGVDCLELVGLARAVLAGVELVDDDNDASGSADDCSNGEDDSKGASEKSRSKSTTPQPKFKYKYCQSVYNVIFMYSPTDSADP